MIDVAHLSKTYNQSAVKALDDVSLQIDEGELFGLIGPDGAGKTTLFQILTTLRLPSEGLVEVNGFDVVKEYHAIRSCIGYMPGRFSLYQDLTVEENLSFFASIFGTSLNESESLVKDIYDQLKPFKKRLTNQLSGGMKQKLALCCAMIHKPKILFLDEPTTGVDAVSRKEFWEMLSGLKKEGITIMVSTAYMDEAILCNRIGLIQSGKMLSIGSPQNIVKSFHGTLFAVRSENIYRLSKDLRSNDRSKSCYPFGEYLHVVFREEFRNSDEILLKLQQLGHHKVEVKKIEASVEDCFIQLLNT